ncbi:MAG: B12-binding domain-containing radical SAM protein [Clostridiales bacterium]|nr:B12-binding domain-containing radical SAM protein [Clostridiales bacterium]
MRYLLCGINAKYIHSNLAIFCLKSYAQENGPDTAVYEIKEYTINHYVENILQDIYEVGADVVIFSCYIWNISYVRELAEELKKVSPNLQIWVGGPEVSYDAERFLAGNPAVNLVMQGEGEQVFTALVTLMEQGELPGEEECSESAAQDILYLQSGKLLLKDMPQGVAWRSGDAIYNTGFVPMMDMDMIPFVYEDFQLFAHKIIYYETSRGCPFSCSYCLSSVEKRVRFRSLSLVMPELQRFLDAGVPQVKFVDRTFNCNKKHAMAIWRYIFEHDNGVTNFHFEISADLLDEEELALFEKMRPGLIQLEIGVQSTNPETIRAIHRPMNLNEVFANVDKVHRMGNIHQHLDLIAGLPKENYAQFRTSFNDLYAHAPDQLQLGFLKVLKGTRMEAEVREHELRYRSRPPYEVLSTRWLSYDEVIRLKGIEELVEMYYNSGQYSCTLQYVIPYFESPFDFFEQFSLEYRKKGYHKLNHSRTEKYEILRNYLRGEAGRRLPCKSVDAANAEVGCGRGAEATHENESQIPYLDEMLVLDLYLRENVKSRPDWAGDASVMRKKVKELYRTRGAELFPEEWTQGSYDSKKAANYSHIEYFHFDVARLLTEGVFEKKDVWCLFDYGRRDPRNKNARVTTLSDF